MERLRYSVNDLTGVDTDPSEVFAN
jgi:hypothetical protein